VSLPTVTDLKQHNNQMSSADDNELQTHLDAAIEIVEGLIGPIGEGSVTETHYGASGGVLVLRRMPASELTAISPRPFPGVTTVPYDVADFVLDPATGIVRAGNGGAFYGDFTVTYSTGYAALPASIHLAVLIIAAHLWETQRMPMQDSGPAGFGMDSDAAPSVPRGFAIPNRAQELLAPYMRPSIA
jgi:hypothetical protein